MRKWISLLCAVVITFCLLPSGVSALSAFRLAVVNFDASLGEDAEAENLPKLLSYVRQAGEGSASIVMFPEYALNSEPDEAIDLYDSASVVEISAAARRYGMYILFGAVVRDSGEVYSAAVVCAPDGSVSQYRKIHLSDEQYADGFTAGEQPYLLSTRFGLFGITLGSEFRDAAELGKYYFYKNCRMVLAMSADYVPTDDETALSQAQFELWNASYAYEYMYGTDVAVSNLCTEDGGALWFGGSHVCSSFSALAADAVSGADEPGILFTDLAGENACAEGISGRQPELLADWYEALAVQTLPDYGGDSPYSDSVVAAAVNFHPIWGDVRANADAMEQIMAEAHEQGVQLLAFPELALTGYSVSSASTCTEALRDQIGGQYMQCAMAQVVRGDNPSALVLELQALAEEYGMYVLIGLPEQDESNAAVYYNSVAILGPELCTTYRKVNPVSPETSWCTAGQSNQDGVFETPFGYVGVGICADIYHYQELQRTYALQGCRIVVNCTAGAGNDATIEYGGWQLPLRSRLESFMLRDGTCMLSANLVGYDGPPLSEALAQSLAEAGYTQEDITSDWLRGASLEYSLIHVWTEGAAEAEVDPEVAEELAGFGTETPETDASSAISGASAVPGSGLTTTPLAADAAADNTSVSAGVVVAQTTSFGDPDNGDEQENDEAEEDSDEPEQSSGGYASLLPSGATIFPGCSVVLGLDADSPTGVTEYGNTSASSALAGTGRSARLLDPDANGKTAFMSYTTDTFNQFYVGVLDLSDALSPIRSNPTAFRPGLYAQWYASLCTALSADGSVQTELTDADTGVTVSGLLREGAVLTVQTSEGTVRASDALADTLGLALPNGYEASYTRYAAAAEYARTVSGYDGIYAALSGRVTVTVPAPEVGAGEYAVLCADGRVYEPENGKFVFQSPMNGGFTVAVIRRQADCELSGEWNELCGALLVWPFPLTRD